MDNFEIEFGSNEDQKQDFTPTPEGEYSLECTSAQLTTAKTGTKIISTEFTILGPSHKGRKVFENFALVTKAIWKLKNFFAAAESPFGSAEGKQSAMEVVSAMAGLRCEAHVGIDSYLSNKENKTKEKNIILSFIIPEEDTDTVDPF